MYKQYKIRWRESDLNELRRVVKNFNSKINRLAKNPNYIKSALPQKASVKELKKLINTRRDFKREINSLKRFSKKGVEEVITFGNYDIKFTKWQQTEMKRRVAVINRRRQKRLVELEQIELTSRGEALGYTKKQFGMGRMEEIELRPMRIFTKGMGQSDFRKKWKSILKQSQLTFISDRDYMMRDNYIKGLLLNYNENDIKGIIDKIMKMDINVFLNKFYAEPSFEGIYFPNQELYNAYLEGLKARWNEE